MNIIVCGSRYWANFDRIKGCLAKLPPSSRIIHGAQRGADEMAGRAGDELGLFVRPYPAHWKHNDPKWVKVYGPCTPYCQQISGTPAGPIRNKRMLTENTPVDFVFAFHNDIDDSKGTKNMVAQAKREKIIVGVFTELAVNWYYPEGDNNGAIFPW